jgi:hypothetical protein
MNLKQKTADFEVAPNEFWLFVKDKGSDPIYLEAKEPWSAEQKEAVYNILGVDGVEASWYNSRNYDDVIMSAAMDGATPERIYEISSALINSNDRAHEVARSFDIQAKSPFIENQLDLLDFAQKTGGLKKRMSRMGMNIFEIPFDPTKPIPEELKPTLIEYGCSDVIGTEKLREELDGEVVVRRKLEEMFDINGLTRKKAAAAAADILVQEYIRAFPEEDITTDGIFKQAKRHQNVEFNWYAPAWLADVVKGTVAQDILSQIDGSLFTIQDGYRQNPAVWPEEVNLDDEAALIGGFGVGGLHSKDTAFDFEGIGVDVTSMYPSIILAGGCSPAHLDEETFTGIYRGILEQRLELKRAGDKLASNALKLILNSSFGQMNYKYSPIYSPREFLNITISGQLSLIALSDRLKSGVVA